MKKLIAILLISIPVFGFSQAELPKDSLGRLSSSSANGKIYPLLRNAPSQLESKENIIYKCESGKYTAIYRWEMGLAYAVAIYDSVGRIYQPSGGDVRYYRDTTVRYTVKQWQQQWDEFINTGALKPKKKKKRIQ